MVADVTLDEVDPCTQGLQHLWWRETVKRCYVEAAIMEISDDIRADVA
jgi:hypothetical protein